MSKNKLTRTNHYIEQFEKTKRNKIRKIEKDLKRNPNNTSAKKSLEHWKTIGKRVKVHRRKVRVF